MLLEWYVYNQDINNREIKPYNVLNHGGFIKGLNQMFKDIKKEQSNYLKVNNLSGLLTTREANKYNKYMESFVDEYLRKECGYYFWSKCETEVVITSWPPYMDVENIDKLKKEIEQHDSTYSWKQQKVNVPLAIGKKIDIYDQLRLNWNAFKRYVLEHEKEIKKQYKEWNNK